jgi:trehalose utilization protein
MKPLHFKYATTYMPGNYTIYYYTPSNQYWPSYYNTMSKITGLLPTVIANTSHYSGIVHHMVFVKEILDNLKQHIETLNPDHPWW